MSKLVTTELRHVRRYWYAQYPAARSHIGVRMRRAGTSSPCVKMVTPRGTAPRAVVVMGSIHQAAAGQAEKHVFQRRPADQRALGDVTHARDLLQRGVAVLGIEKDSVRQNLLAFRQGGQRRCDFLVLSRRKPQFHDLLRRERFDELPRRALCSKTTLVHHD